MRKPTNQIYNMNRSLDDRAVSFVTEHLHNRVKGEPDLIDTRFHMKHLDSSYCTDLLCNQKRVWIRAREFDDKQYAKYKGELVLRVSTNTGNYKSELIKLATLPLVDLPVCFYYLFFDAKGQVRGYVILNQNFLVYIRSFYDANNPNWFKKLGSFINCANSNQYDMTTDLLAIRLSSIPKNCFMQVS